MTLDRRQALHYGCLLLILFIATGLRVHRLTHDSFWEDEFYTVELTLGRGHAHFDLPVNVVIENPPQLTDLHEAAPCWTSWTSESHDTLPPLYIVIMRFWGTVFGQTDAAARSFSVVTSIAAVALLYILCRALHGPT